MINIHPSFLPAFPGMDAIGQAFRAKVRTTGVTIHYIDEGMDTGPIIAQEEVAIQESDTRASLAKRIQKTEHRSEEQTSELQSRGHLVCRLLLRTYNIIHNLLH